MNYQHCYHAGNHADVFKHLVLMCLLEHFKLKSKRFCYIDTHAGSGQYNLNKIPKTPPEFHKGIRLLHQNYSPIMHPVIKYYSEIQKDLNCFHGSPAIGKLLLRPQDEMILIEKSPEIYDNLKKIFSKNIRDNTQKNIHIHHLDAQMGLKSLLPPPIKRALILIDPVYEDINEHQTWLSALKQAVMKFPTACYVLWYPIKSRENIRYFYQQIKNMGISAQKLILEFCPLPDDVGLRLNGSGLLMIHPPFEFEKTIQPVLTELIQHLKQQNSGFQNCFFI